MSRMYLAVEYLTVRELKDFLNLKDVSDDALVIINGETLHGVEMIEGRLSNSESYSGSKYFTAVPPSKSNRKAIQFVRMREMSTGEMDYLPV